METLREIWDWFLVNPARLLVLASLLITLKLAWEEWLGRNTGGSGWLTLARIVVGGGGSLLTAIVAGFYSGPGAFFGYLVLQLFVAVVLPVILVERMSDIHRWLARK